ncbi:hypothetical protein NLU13_6843 [Sarocladium strictum]|uniref:Protein kinase domain-containing protein n=1 Tax=Sarocladium strictum TaxID=5046 RepID=A0AA39L5V8_SARSR|nr:hypothetical protein NLU13_6843 [Sarocladium strictum]
MISNSHQVLVVTLHEGRGLSLPPGSQNEGSRATEFLQKGSNSRLLPYAILSFNGSDGFLRAVSGTTQAPRWGDTKMRIACEPGSLEATDLTVRFCMQDSAGQQNGRDMSLGFIKTNIFLSQTSQTRSERLQVQNGTGQIRLDIACTGNAMAQMGSFFPTCIWKYGECFEHDTRIKRQSGERSQEQFQYHAMDKRLLSPRLNVVRPLFIQASSPFIAPLRFVSEHRQKIILFSPYLEGGPLFYWLQRARCFDVARSRFYAAELLCALEDLHNFDSAYRGVKPKHIHLDAVGHVAICDFGLFGMEEDDTKHRLPRPALECPAPETLSGQASTDAVKWWTLGVFLYEMLTGLPPFYHEEHDEVHRRILSEPPPIPDSLPVSAQDLLSKLLIRQPGDRLGAKGVTEIKAHPFFNGLDWGKVARREYAPGFKPPEFSTYYRYPVCWVQHPPQTIAERFSGFSYKTPIKLEHETSPPLVSVNDSPQGLTNTSQLAAVLSHPPVATKLFPPPKDLQTVTYEDNNWELIWEQASREFHFYNPATKVKQPIRAHYPLAWSGRDESLVSKSSSAAGDGPDEVQKDAALIAIVKNKYRHLVPRFLGEYRPTLNLHCRAEESPLQLATEQEDVDLVKLFLANGADANQDISEFSTRWPLRTAVNRGNRELVEILVSRTKRAACTKALSLAVCRGNAAIVETLLANGVRCDFEESDRAKPVVASGSELSGQCTFTGESDQPDECLPPVVAAISSHETELLRLLLAHGANPNVGYHGLSMVRFTTLDRELSVECARAIQLAMALEYDDMVQILLDSGADIDLAQPVWVHQCEMIPSTSYLKITAGLRAAVTKRDMQRQH